MPFRCRCSSPLLEPTYRVPHLLLDLGWVDFDLGVPPSCPAAQPLLPNSHQPRQSRADSGTLEIRVNKIQSPLTWDTLYNNNYHHLSPTVLYKVEIKSQEFCQFHMKGDPKCFNLRYILHNSYAPFLRYGTPDTLFWDKIIFFSWISNNWLNL